MTVNHRVPDIRIKRVYAEQEPDDGIRILVDRLWPRGLHKSDVKMDLWLKDVAPSPELRHWFGHDPAHWDVFQARYRQELSQPNAALERMQASKRLKTSAFSQVALQALPDKKAEQEQLFRRVRGWLNPQNTD